MTFETGLDEIGLEMKQAANSRLRGDSELPTRDEVIEVICNVYWALDVSSAEDAADALILRGWLRVRQS